MLAYYCYTNQFLYMKTIVIFESLNKIKIRKILFSHLNIAFKVLKLQNLQEKWFSVILSN